MQISNFAIPMNEQIKSHAILITTALIAGFNYSISKMVMPEFMSPSAIILLRVLSASVFFWMLSFIITEKKEPIKKDFIRILICAFFGIAANQLLFYEGLNLTTPINASLMMSSSPVLVLIISAFAIGEKITFSKILGIAIGACGAILLLINSKSMTNTLFLGDLLVLLNAASYAIFLVLVKPLMKTHHPITIVKWIFTLGFLMVLPFGLKDVNAVLWSELPTHALLSLLFIIIFATLIAYYLNVNVLQYVNPSVAGIYMYFQPVLASIIAISLGKDVLSLEKVIYSLFILLGIFLVSRKSPKKTEA
jgi:drug/metabolite transporter (DMT)-like permease